MSFLRADRELSRQNFYESGVVRGAGFAPLDEEADCDVAVVGGGLAGLSAALELADRGLSVRLLEAGQIGQGASGRNGGQAIHGLACDIGEIEAQLGETAARAVFAMTIEALDLIRERCRRFGIAADWRDGWLGVAKNARKARELLDGAEHLDRRYGHPLEPISADQLPAWVASPLYCAGVHDPRSGHLHPLKYTLGLARAAAGLGARLHEQTPVTALQLPGQGGAPADRALLTTPRGRVRARQVLLAGNVYLQGLAPALARRIMPVGTYVIATEPVSAEQARAAIPCGAAVCDNDFVLDYYRFSADHRMLFGGRVSYSTVTPSRLAERMRARLAATLPALAGVPVSHAWGGFVDITMNRAPDFGRLPGAPAVYYVQGFSGHGVALTGLAGRLVAEAVAGDASRFDTFARLRHRAFPGGRWLRTPTLVLGMAWYQLKEALG